MISFHRAMYLVIFLRGGKRIRLSENFYGPKSEITPFWPRSKIRLRAISQNMIIFIPLDQKFYPDFKSTHDYGPEINLSRVGEIGENKYLTTKEV